MINLEDAKRLTHGTTIYSNRWTNADGSPERWRVNGMVKRWKRDRDRIQIPIKRGLWQYDYLTNANLADFELDEQAAQAAIDG